MNKYVPWLVGLAAIGALLDQTAWLGWDPWFGWIGLALAVIAFLMIVWKK